MEANRDKLNEPDAPNIGIRRWGDGCFHPVEETLPEGFIVKGILIPRSEVVSIIDLDTGQILPKSDPRLT